jgi:cytochrome c
VRSSRKQRAPITPKQRKMEDKLRTLSVILSAMMLASAAAPAQALSGNAKLGAQLFGACAACHSLTPNRNMTGPSLAGIWGRKAGTLASFDRYSPEIKASGITWNEGTLNFWLTNPAKVIPGNSMPFDGIDKPQVRADLIAYLKDASAGQAPGASSNMGGMMGGGMKGP